MRVLRPQGLHGRRGHRERTTCGASRGRRQIGIPDSPVREHVRHLRSLRGHPVSGRDRECFPWSRRSNPRWCAVRVHGPVDARCVFSGRANPPDRGSRRAGVTRPHLARPASTLRTREEESTVFRGGAKCAEKPVVLPVLGAGCGAIERHAEHLARNCRIRDVRRAILRPRVARTPSRPPPEPSPPRRKALWYWAIGHPAQAHRDRWPRGYRRLPELATYDGRRDRLRSTANSAAKSSCVTPVQGGKWPSEVSIYWTMTVSQPSGIL